MLQYISDAIVPFLSRVRHDLGVGKEQAVLVIFDKFRGQLTANFIQTQKITTFSQFLYMYLLDVQINYSLST